MPKGKKRHKKGSGGTPHRASKRTPLGSRSLPAIPPIVPFGEVIAEAPVLRVKIQGAPTVPDGKYSLIDAYCTDPDCDCRKAYIVVRAENTAEDIAYISVGWESLSFYKNWMKAPRPPGISLADLKGPSLMPMMPQSSLAKPLLEVLRSYFEDPEKIGFYKERYFQFKAHLVERP